MSKSNSSGANAIGNRNLIMEAGEILNRLAIVNFIIISDETLQTPDIKIDLQRVRQLLAEAKPSNAEEGHRYLAAKTVLEALETIERGEKPLPYLDQFRGHVEAVRGGEGAEVFGGRRVSNKPSRNVSTTLRQ